MLGVRDLTSGYGRIQILFGVSLEVADGEVVGVLGHNGMGKSTLLKTLIGNVATTGGHIEFDGQDITGMPTYKRVHAGLGYVPQGRQIFPALSVGENLRMGVKSSAESVEDCVEAILEDFPRLKPLLDRTGGALSGGEQQLLAMARCLCGSPRLMLLDEPTEGIQPSIIEEMIERLSLLKDKRSLTIVLVEQNLDFIKALSKRVLIMQKGRIVSEVDAAQLSDPELMHEFAVGAD